MHFNSYEFVYLFLPSFFLVYGMVVRARPYAGRWVLCVASLVFYSFLALHVLPLLLGSVLVNFFCGRCILKTHNRNILILGVSLNLIVLFVFKYALFVSEAFLGMSFPLLKGLLPLGISFYTFTQIAFLVDSYRAKVSSDQSFVSYLLFVTYFPHLIAGPVLHHKEMLDQFEDKTRYNLNYGNLGVGLTFFIAGLAEKILIADKLMPYVHTTFDAVQQGGTLVPLEAWCGALCYSFQLYFDFMGYSDMAIGLSKMLNFDLPVNFNSPYQALSLIDFWHRWHMSLSRFLKDYVYIPLGGNRCRYDRWLCNVFMTMLLGGLWHGANWTFCVWGAYHGLLLVANHVIAPFPWQFPAFLRRMTVWLAVIMGWVIFRADNLTVAFRYLACMWDVGRWSNMPSQETGALVLRFSLMNWLLLLVLGLYCLYGPNTGEMIQGGKNLAGGGCGFLSGRWNARFLTALKVALLFIVCMYYIDKPSDFIYWQF